MIDYYKNENDLIEDSMKEISENIMDDDLIGYAECTMIAERFENIDKLAKQGD